MIEIVSATRMTENQFWSNSALGLSLERFRYDNRLSVNIAFENRKGLPDVFNAQILKKTGPDILVFIHDDIWINDYFIADRVLDGLSSYDVIGVAGNRRRLKNQPTWAFKSFIDGGGTWDDKEQLSGSVAGGKTPFGRLSYFGPAPAECELLDGIFLATKKSTLVNHSVLFDPKFDFHFYDMDFCRSARAKNLRLGTWPISLTHQSGGAFNSQNWNTKFQLYCEKWERPSSE
jgi:glycosyltransferase involved in cell wall biosynthesis